MSYSTDKFYLLPKRDVPGHHSSFRFPFLQTQTLRNLVLRTPWLGTENMSYSCHLILGTPSESHQKWRFLFNSQLADDVVRPACDAVVVRLPGATVFCKWVLPIH